MSATKIAQLPGGKADKAGKSASDFNPASLRKGMAVEREHTPNKTLQKFIAEDHLTEDPKYYEKLKLIEKDAMMSAFLEELEKKAYEIEPEDRPSIPKKQFAQPNKEEAGHKGKYPIPDAQHYRSALGFAKMHGDTAAYAAIKAKGRKMGYESEQEKTAMMTAFLDELEKIAIGAEQLKDMPHDKVREALYAEGRMSSLHPSDPMHPKNFEKHYTPEKIKQMNRQLNPDLGGHGPPVELSGSKVQAVEGPGTVIKARPPQPPPLPKRTVPTPASGAAQSAATQVGPPPLPAQAAKPAPTQAARPAPPPIPAQAARQPPPLPKIAPPMQAAKGVLGAASKTPPPLPKAVGAIGSVAKKVLPRLV